MCQVKVNRGDGWRANPNSFAACTKRLFKDFFHLAKLHCLRLSTKEELKGTVPRLYMMAHGAGSSSGIPSDMVL